MLMLRASEPIRQAQEAKNRVQITMYCLAEAMDRVQLAMRRATKAMDRVTEAMH
ncbi:hypothetical protein [Leptolyngbya sp. FACHB-711]|uniref:hypothetical protein n=1 Tax=Leptolyngbya sp. FACHB-711 TaxID=2692813 RepID=UPI001989B1B3|nr:hypothetical protein [Leptolyngbya sp. FACHB-711]MBD1850458.1 hypothetical protein [Cyanobacteria bacterium FACHB-502]MBD2026040.1 hypothetical protein [Leptolyngbya sp. FACHB-711]